MEKNQRFTTTPTLETLGPTISKYYSSNGHIEGFFKFDESGVRYNFLDLCFCILKPIDDLTLAELKKEVKKENHQSYKFISNDLSKIKNNSSYLFYTKKNMESFLISMELVLSQEDKRYLVTLSMGEEDDYYQVFYFYCTHLEPLTVYTGFQGNLINLGTYKDIQCHSLTKTLLKNNEIIPNEFLEIIWSYFSSRIAKKLNNPKKSSFHI